MNETIYDEETLCTACHGRGLDERDRSCPHCQGTGMEPLNTFETRLQVYIRARA